MKKSVVLGVLAVVIGAIVLVTAVAFIFIPTPGQAIIKYALPQEHAQGISPLNHSGATNLSLKGQTSAEARRVLQVMNAFERDILQGEPRDICSMLSHVAGSRFFKDDRQSQHLFAVLEVGRAENIDPMGEHGLQVLDFFKIDPEIPALIAMVRHELRSANSDGLLDKFQQKWHFISLATSWSSRMNSPEQEKSLNAHLGKLAHYQQLITFLNENPQYAEDKDVRKFCSEIPKLADPASSFQSLMKQKGL